MQSKLMACKANMMLKSFALFKIKFPKVNNGGQMSEQFGMPLRMDNSKFIPQEMIGKCSLIMMKKDTASINDFLAKNSLNSSTYTLSFTNFNCI